MIISYPHTEPIPPEATAMITDKGDVWRLAGPGRWTRSDGSGGFTLNSMLRMCEYAELGTIGLDGTDRDVFNAVAALRELASTSTRPRPNQIALIRSILAFTPLPDPKPTSVDAYADRLEELLAGVTAAIPNILDDIYRNPGRAGRALQRLADGLADDIPRPTPKGPAT